MEVVTLALVGVLIVWIGVITYFVWQLRLQLAIFTKDGKSESLAKVLVDIVKDIEKSDREIHDIGKQVSLLERDGRLHIQRIGLLRFNPFKDTGGEQSFVLSIVDKEDSGIVLSGLYSRSGTRWYAKKVVHGKGVDVELSTEEQKAVALAKT